MWRASSRCLQEPLSEQTETHRRQIVKRLQHRKESLTPLKQHGRQSGLRTRALRNLLVEGFLCYPPQMLKLTEGQVLLVTVCASLGLRCQTGTAKPTNDPTQSSMSNQQATTRQTQQQP